ncbi:hypothetical protein Vafri_20921 [Volvox africanus]|uniref:Uncharacterized protein n=1 Tax=Volvox africanus TaxID=51714 RepID=A0A8J4FA26_9CHLO|nr:hypothetical protein Vafri_20921 [Volvox africanus]
MWCESVHCSGGYGASIAIKSNIRSPFCSIDSCSRVRQCLFRRATEAQRRSAEDGLLGLQGPAGKQPPQTCCDGLEERQLYRNGVDHTGSGCIATVSCRELGRLGTIGAGTRRNPVAIGNDIQVLRYTGYNINEHSSLLGYAQ